jgi:transposase
MNEPYQRYRRYDADYKRNAVELLLSSGRPIAEVANDLGIPYKTLERWKSQVCVRGASQALSGGDAQELQRLRRQLAHVERERDILKKALAICSRDPSLLGRSS